MKEMQFQDAAEGYLKYLNSMGIDYIFCSPGSEFIPIWEHLAKLNAEGKNPQYLNLRHEGTALSMAKGYTMATGKCQVVMTHVITGLLHGAMELKAAYTDNIPIILVVGQNKTHDREVFGGSPGPHYLSFTEVGGQQRLVQPYVKWSEEPITNENIPIILQRAHDIASTDVKGPVLISIARELLFEKNVKVWKPDPRPEPPKMGVDPNLLKKLAESLIQSWNPLIYTRYLGRNPDTVKSLVELSHLLSIPVFETPGYMNFPTNNPLHMGNDILPYLEEADMILIIDSSGWPPWYPPNSVRERSKAKIVFIDVDPLQNKYPVYSYPADILIRGDSGIILPLLIEEIHGMKLNKDRIMERKRNWKEEGVRLRKGLIAEALSLKNERPIDPRWLCYCINEVIDDETIIIHETITHGRLIHKYIEKNRVKPRTRYEATGPIAHTGLGQGLGVALGVKLAEPGKKIIALEGDGSFNYNPIPASLGASQEYKLPILIVIFDNQCYAAMKHHERYYPEGFSVRNEIYYGVPCHPKPDYQKFAEAYGGYADTIEDPSRLIDGLEKAFSELEKGKLVLLDVLLRE
jgi:acetolactate synthase-1/2/3 large subunit